MLDKMGAIVAADDQLINLEVLKNSLNEIGVCEKVQFCVNGQEAIDAVKRIIEAYILNPVLIDE